MAVEVILGYHRFNLDPQDRFESNLRKIKQRLPLEEDTAPLAFSHNALHDLESLWWVCICELLFYRDQSWAPVSDEAIQRREDTMYMLFPRTTEINHRQGFLDKQAVFLRMLQWMPKDYSVFKLQLGTLRMLIVLCYEASGRKLVYQGFDCPHKKFVFIFQKWSRLAGEKNIQLEPYKWTTGRAESEEKGEPTASSLGKRRLEDDEFLVPHPRQDVDV